MDDIFHILQLLKLRAEADLALLQAQKNKLEDEIKKIRQKLNEQEGRCLEDIMLWQKWRKHQAEKIKISKTNIDQINQDIKLAKKYFAKILAKCEMAKNILNDNKKQKDLLKEEAENETQIELFRSMISQTQKK